MNNFGNPSKWKGSNIFCSWPKVKMRQKINGEFHFCICLNRATFFLEGDAITLNVSQLRH